MTDVSDSVVDGASTVPTDPTGGAAAAQEPNAAAKRNGFARHFECRPGFRLGRSVISDVVDASTVRERKAGDLMVVRIGDVLSGSTDSFIGFGLPNEYLVTPDNNGGFQKFAVKSLRRAPSEVVDTRGWVQSGIWIRFKNIPAEAHEKLREAMQFYSGWRFWTCANGIMHVLDRAGFASRSVSKMLTDLYMPYPCFAHITKHGLTYNGRVVEFDVIKTTPSELHHFSWQIRKATVLTLCRHANRNLDDLASKNKAAGWVKKIVAAPAALFAKTKQANARPVRVAPALPAGVAYESDLRVRVSKPNFIGSVLRLLWGSHALFEAQQTRVDPAQYFTEVLQPFPHTPTVVSKAKKWVLFRPAVIWAIRRFLAPEFVDIGLRSESNIYDMLRTSTPERREIYNIVITSRGLTNDGTPAGNPRIILSRISAGSKLADWVLSKHVLASGYDAFTVFAAEVWKDENGVVHMNLNSGTYQPKVRHQIAAHAFIRAVLPHWPIVVES